MIRYSLNPNKNFFVLILYLFCTFLYFFVLFCTFLYLFVLVLVFLTGSGSSHRPKSNFLQNHSIGLNFVHTFCILQDLVPYHFSNFRENLWHRYRENGEFLKKSPSICNISETVGNTTTKPGRLELELELPPPFVYEGPAVAVWFILI